MNAWPARALGGSSPVVAIFRHSMTVWRWRGEGYAGEKNVREKNAGRMGASRGELGTPPRERSGVSGSASIDVPSFPRRCARR
jgi:hypothetical protein